MTVYKKQTQIRCVWINYFSFVAIYLTMSAQEVGAVEVTKWKQISWAATISLLLTVWYYCKVFVSSVNISCVMGIWKQAVNRNSCHVRSICAINVSYIKIFYFTHHFCISKKKDTSSRHTTFCKLEDFFSNFSVSLSVFWYFDVHIEMGWWSDCCSEIQKNEAIFTVILWPLHLTNSDLSRVVLIAARCFL